MLPSTDHAVTNGEGDTLTHLTAVLVMLLFTNHAVSNRERILQLTWQLSFLRSPAHDVSNWDTQTELAAVPVMLHSTRSCCQQWRWGTQTHLAAVLATLSSTDHAVSNGEGILQLHNKDYLYLVQSFYSKFDLKVPKCEIFERSDFDDIYTKKQKDSMGW
jgi:hypothetical protein